jgi:MFS transporter, SP family, sugar:H+ symporter
MRDRAEESYETLKKIRRGRYSDEQINTEFEELKVIISDQLTESRWAELFHGQNLRRTWITVGTNFFLQITGQVFTAKYGTVYIQSLGTIDAFTMTAINQAINVSAVLVAMYLADKIGRR